MKVKFLICILGGLALSTCAHETFKTEFHCQGEIKNFTVAITKTPGRSESFMPHSGNKKFENYVSLSLPFLPFQKLFSDIQVVFGKLQNRGEAHITVITPVEYDEVLSPFIKIDELNEIAKQRRLQQSVVDVRCLGKAESEKLASYYIVVQSEDLLRFRKIVFKLFTDRGGMASRFDPDNYYPHITVGFNLRDLHESDGVKKGLNSCLSKVTPQL